MYVTYAILFNPGHNRVYFETSLKLSLSEFGICAQNFSTPYQNLQTQNICGVEYLTFETANHLAEPDIKIISCLSFVYAIFELKQENNETYMKPLAKNNNCFVNESIGTILKYTGKTNEVFTKMLLNIAYNSQSSKNEIKLLDPVAGKGTTLFEGLVMGFNVYGIEIADSVVNESYHFTKRFLETARYKFTHKETKISGANKSFSALRRTFETAATKEELKTKNTRTIEFIAGNSQHAATYYKKNFFNLIVGDLPYGVQHGNVTKQKQSSLTRNPLELLTACLPAWVNVLKAGGVIVLSWNSNVLPRTKLADLFLQNGLKVFDEAAYLQFEHRVDQSILRNIIVAKKP